MKVADLFELAKQGYKPGEIKELVELGQTLEAREAEQINETAVKEKAESDESIKTLNEQVSVLTDKLNKANELIKELQANNIEKDISKTSPVDELAEIGKLFI